MTAPHAWSKQRLLVPRWKAFQTIQGTGELASAKPRQRRAELTQPSKDFEKRLLSWKERHSLKSAAELIEVALVENRTAEALQAAQIILTSEEHAAVAIKYLAADLLAKHGQLDDKSSQIAQNKSSPRKILGTNLTDPFAWLDLALLQVKGGHLDAASKSTTVALRLAPHNRFVLRTASRFYLHSGDAERAHDLLVKNAATQNDPWLISAEIAMSGMASRRPAFAKVGLKALDSGDFSDKQMSELSSSLATLEMNGSRKKMLQLFRLSLVDPTGNSLAQAAWAEPLARVELLNGTGKISCEYEACAHQAYSKGDFEKALSHCENWIADEEYSSRPYQFGAATAGALDDYEASIRLTDKGLMLEPNSIGLRLSKIYALAIANRLQEAKKVIGTFTNETDKYVCAILKADEGLIAFRSGDTQNGKALYLEALKNFKSLGNQESLKTACAYLAREAALAKDEEAEALFNAAIQINSSTSFSNLAIRVLNEAGRALGKTSDALPQRLKPMSSSITWKTQNDSGVVKVQR